MHEAEGDVGVGMGGSDYDAKLTLPLSMTGKELMRCSVQRLALYCEPVPEPSPPAEAQGKTKAQGKAKAKAKAAAMEENKENADAATRTGA